MHRNAYILYYIRISKLLCISEPSEYFNVIFPIVKYIKISNHLAIYFPINGIIYITGITSCNIYIYSYYPARCNK